MTVPLTLTTTPRTLTATQKPAAELHELSFCSFVAAKALYLGAFILEAVPVVLGTLAVLAVALPWTRFTIVASIALPFIAVLVGAYANSVRSFAEQCRQDALRSYSLDVTIDDYAMEFIRDRIPIVVSLLRSCAPKQIESRMKNQQLESYYNPMHAPGAGRLCELYAQSSFYASNAAFYFAIVCSVVLGLFAAGLFVLFLFAPADYLNVSGGWQQAIGSVIAGVFMVRFLSIAVSSIMSHREFKALSQDFLKVKQEGREDTALLPLTTQYEVAAATSPPIPMIVYNFVEPWIDGRWDSRKDLLRPKP